jgi:hypothetical protein
MPAPTGRVARGKLRGKRAQDRELLIFFEDCRPEPVLKTRRQFIWLDFD